MIKFFLMTRGRTGSTAIIDELNKSDSLLVMQELFLLYNTKAKANLKEHYSELPRFDVWKSKSFWNRFLNEEKVADRYLSRAEGIANKASASGFGFKVLSHHFSERSYLTSLLKEHNYKALYLTRNGPRQVLSGMVAQQRGLYNTKKAVDDSKRYVIDVGDFKKRVSWEAKSIEKDLDFLGKWDFDYCRVTYEDYCNDRKAFFSKVFGFLELPGELPEVSDYTIMIKSLEHTIENYEEVLNCVKALGLSL